MNAFIGAGAAAGLLLAGCGSAVAVLVPATVAGIPVHQVAWNRPMPNLHVPSPRQTAAPGSYRVAPKDALQDVLRAAAYLRANATAFYIQAASLSGAGANRPPAAYVVEAVGNNFKDLGHATSEWMLFIVDGGTGKVTPKEGGAKYGG